MERKKFKKTRDFLSQIPDWEDNYKTSDRLDIDYDKRDWVEAKAEFSEHDLKILGEPVMEDWEDPYMRDLAEIVTSKGGTVLELGFGMGISARYIQSNQAVKKHIIIEANKGVAEKAREFARESKIETIILEGFWEKVIDEIPNGSLDGILFDTYPVEEIELYQNHFKFFPFAFRKLRNGGIFTYYSDEAKKFGSVHLKKLQEAGFSLEKIRSRIVNIDPPKDCEYWKDKTILSPIITK